jgi:hypothetical protein
MEIRKFKETYVDKPIHPAQDNFMMYKCLMNSISKEGKNKILSWKKQYTMGTNSSGNLLLKIIVEESHLDTNATTTSIRNKLSSLDEYILTIGCNITKFNGYVRLLINSLAARGETTQDLLTNLFKGYNAVNDKVFVSYIGRKLEKCEEGETITSEMLMQLGNNKFKLLKEGGIWNAPSVEEEQILALQTEVKKLQKNVTKKVDSKKTDKKSRVMDKTNFKGRAKLEKPHWFFQEPKEDQINKPKFWNNRSWCYCFPKTGGKCDGKYRAHKPSDCKGQAHVFNPNKKQKPTADKDSDHKLKLAKACEAAKEVSSGEESK